jgi:hypothetical protein
VSISYHVYVVWDVKEPLSLKWRSGFLAILSSLSSSLHSHIYELMGRNTIFINESLTAVTYVFTVFIWCRIMTRYCLFEPCFTKRKEWKTSGIAWITTLIYKNQERDDAIGVQLEAILESNGDNASVSYHKSCNSSYTSVSRIYQAIIRRNPVVCDMLMNLIKELVVLKYLTLY